MGPELMQFSKDRLKDLGQKLRPRLLTQLKILMEVSN